MRYGQLFEPATQYGCDIKSQFLEFAVFCLRVAKSPTAPYGAKHWVSYVYCPIFELIYWKFDYDMCPPSVILFFFIKKKGFTPSFGVGLKNPS